MLSNTSIKGAWSVSLTFVGALSLVAPVHWAIWYPSNACEMCRDRLEGQRVTVERERERERERKKERESANYSIIDTPLLQRSMQSQTKSFTKTALTYS